MFSKYWRSYPWWLQLILFILMIFTMAFFFMAISIFLVSKYTGVDSTQLTTITDKSPQRIIDGALIVQVLLSIGIFVVPALLFSYVTTPRPRQYLGFRKPGKPVHWLLVTGIFIGLLPLALELGSLMSHVNLGPAAKELEEKTTKMQNAFLKMNTPLDLLRTFTCFAILPALGEEMTFRGIMMRFAAKRSKRIFFPILISAILFASQHSNVSGLPSIFLSGILLGYIYYLTSSLWCSVWGHMLYNGIQIVITYLARGNTSVNDAMSNNALPAYVVISGGILFTVSLWLLIKNRTPLPSDWTNDYDETEEPEKRFLF